jgi:hypothetical protein
MTKKQPKTPSLTQKIPKIPLRKKHTSIFPSKESIDNSNPISIFVSSAKLGTIILYTLLLIAFIFEVDFGVGSLMMDPEFSMGLLMRDLEGKIGGLFG